MNFTIAVSEIKELFSLIKEEPAKLFEMMELSIQKQVGDYLSKLMDMELTGHLGRKPYQRAEEGGKPKNYRNASPPALTACVNKRAGGDIYSRKFFIKNIGEVATKVPRDRDNEFHTKVLPKAKRLDERLSNIYFLAFKNIYVFAKKYDMQCFYPESAQGRYPC